MIYIKNMYITCVVIDHRQNLTIHLSIGSQTYPNRQRIRKRMGRVILCRRILNLSKQAERWKKEGDGSNYVGKHQTYKSRQNVEKNKKMPKIDTLDALDGEMTSILNTL